MGLVTGDGGYVLMNDTAALTEDNSEMHLAPSTSCANCVFSDKFLGNHQVGCKLGRVERFRKTADVAYHRTKYQLVSETLDGLEISLKEANQYVLVHYEDNNLVSIDEEFIDEPNSLHETSYYIINNRFCNTYRSKQWETEHSNPVHDVMKEVALQLSIIIYFDKSHTAAELQNTIQSVIGQKLENAVLPVEVIVLNNQNKIPVTPLIEHLSAHGIAWRNHRSLWENADKGVVFDGAMNFIKGRYFALVDAGFEIPTEFTERLNDSLNYRLERWLCLTHSKCLVAQTKITQILGGTQDIKPTGHNEYVSNIEDKIKYFADKSNQPWMVDKLINFVSIK